MYDRRRVSQLRGQSFSFCCVGCRVHFQLGDTGGDDDFLGLRLKLSEGQEVHLPLDRVRHAVYPVAEAGGHNDWDVAGWTIDGPIG